MNKGKIDEMKENKENREATVDIQNEIQKENNVDNVTKDDNTDKRGKGVLGILGKFVEVIIWITMFFFLGILVVTTLSSKTEVFGHRIYVIMSGSMEPTIKVKDLIITEKADNVQVGDIIAFEDNGHITVHRVIKIYNNNNEKLFETKGDANNTADKTLIKEPMIKGKVKYKVQGLGAAIIFLQGHLMILILAISILIVVIVVRRVIYNG